MFWAFGVFFVVYYIIYVLLWLFLDCNVALWWKSHFGHSIDILRSRVIWVTGASDGIGKALALTLAKHGVKLVLSARRQNLLEEVKLECIQVANGLLSSEDVLVLPFDMLEIDKHQKCLNDVVKHFGHVDLLVNNAGRTQRAPFLDIEIQVDRDIFELDVFSVLHLSRLVSRYFINERNGKGHIAATSSIAGMLPVFLSASYCSAKHALNAYLNCLSLEHSNINVTIFNAGPVATNILQNAFTAKRDEKLDQEPAGQNKLSVERCSFLFAIALANKMKFVWCGLFPINFLAYVSKYPKLTSITRHCISGETLCKLREGKFFFD